MRRVLPILSLLFFSFAAQAHVGSPDVFYEGNAGPYLARINIRMPNVVPGRAEISVRVQTDKPVEASFLPLYSDTAITNAPPADNGRLVKGETNLYAGDLWLMSFGAYSVEVRIKGELGEGVARIPVTSVALRQLPLPSALGKMLLGLAAMLVVGGIGIAAAAGREAALAPGTNPGKRHQWSGFFAASSAAVLCALALVGGKYWWNAEEKAFRHHLREGAWPDLAAEVHAEGSDRILRLDVGKEFFQHNQKSFLIPDHGKLMHLFLVRENGRDAFAHLHPIHKDGYVFEVALPPLPEGRYAIFCDLTFEGGVSSTATNSILLPPTTSATGSASGLERDPDDSWASFSSSGVPAPETLPQVYRLSDGSQITWQSSKPLQVRQDASLRFALTDATGEPLPLEPYMGMLAHAAVLRSDGSVFAHLHPSGNFSMAAQNFFETKLENEQSGLQNSPNETANHPASGHDHMMHHARSGNAAPSIYLPYEFPEPGNYRIWVQFKTAGRILTGVFDARVGRTSSASP